MLQAALPFKSKPKDKTKQARKTLEQKRAVVQGPQERKAVSLMQQLSAIRNQQEVKRRQAQQKRNEVGATTCISTSSSPRHPLGRLCTRGGKTSACCWSSAHLPLRFLTVGYPGGQLQRQWFQGHWHRPA